MGLSNDFFDRLFFLFHIHAPGRLETLDEDFFALLVLDRRSRVCFKEQEPQLFVVVLETTDEIESILAIEAFEELPQLGVVAARGEASIEFDRLRHKLLRQLHNVWGEPTVQGERRDVL